MHPRTQLSGPAFRRRSDREQESPSWAAAADRTLCRPVSPAPDPSPRSQPRGAQEEDDHVFTVLSYDSHIASRVSFPENQNFCKNARI